MDFNNLPGLARSLTNEHHTRGLPHGLAAIESGLGFDELVDNIRLKMPTEASDFFPDLRAAILNILPIEPDMKDFTRLWALGGLDSSELSTGKSGIILFAFAHDWATMTNGVVRCRNGFSLDQVTTSYRRMVQGANPIRMEQATNVSWSFRPQDMYGQVTAGFTVGTNAVGHKLPLSSKGRK